MIYFLVETAFSDIYPFMLNHTSDDDIDNIIVQLVRSPNPIKFSISN